MPKRVLVGVVKSDRMKKSRRVEIPRQVRHPKFGKIIHKKTVCHVHDENEDSHEGDTVEIIESRPHSKLKRWELVRVVKKSDAIDIAAMRAAQKLKQAETAGAESE
jgi:small subunit ribosomal protein S17